MGPQANGDWQWQINKHAVKNGVVRTNSKARVEEINKINIVKHSDIQCQCSGVSGTAVFTLSTLLDLQSSKNS